MFEKSTYRREAIMSRILTGLVVFLASFAVFAQPPSWAVDGTTGAPLGGGGCGAIKFKASDGTFSSTFNTPCALGNFKTLLGTQFQAYTNRASAIVTNQKLSSVITSGRSDDDAAYPIHTANFGTINNVSLSLTAVSPVNFSDADQMTRPYVFYQITATNTAATPVDLAIAMQSKPLENTDGAPIPVKNFLTTDKSGSGLTMELFKGINFDTQVATQTSQQSINYADNLPFTGSNLLPGTNFSLRWTGYLVPDSTSTYTLIRTSDDGVRMWLDTNNNGTFEANEELVNDWNGHQIQTSQAQVNLVAGRQYKFKMEFFQATGGYTVSLKWYKSNGTVPTLVAGKGFKDVTSSIQLALYGASDDPAAIISVGSDNGFLTTGQCNNATTPGLNRVAVKVTLAANQTRKFKFVYSWYNGTVPDRFHYLSTFTNAGAVADSGLANFDQFIANATTFVSRVRASNLPSWLTNQALVSYCNFTNNSIYMKDGRYVQTEGMFNINGTMDQMWHARWIYIQSTPAIMWQEMKYWARTQMTNPVGQIHHDVSGGGGMPVVFPWDDQQHYDYRGIDTWVDLDCAFITSIYELFISTDDRSQLDFLWPYLKLAAQRIRNLVTQYGNATYPGTFDGTQNSYDAGGSPDPYNASLSAAAYRMVSYLAGVEGDSTLKQTYTQAFTTVVNSFKNRYLTNNFPSGRISESVMTGEWLGLFLKLGSFWDSSSVAYALKSLDTYYNPLANGLGFTGGTYNEWAPYLVSHYAGLELQTGHFAEWKNMQLDWWERNFNDRNRVFNQELSIPSKVTSPTYIASSVNGYQTYISVPVVWRNYYTIAGFFRNKHSGELWLEPTMFADLNHQLTNACVISPEGYATISCTESGTNFNTQTIVFKPDNPMPVTALYVRDKGLTATTYVSVNGVAQTFTRIGGGFAKELKVAYSGTVPSSGITVVVSDQPVGVGHGLKRQAVTEPLFIQTGGMFTIRIFAGMHEIRIISADGKKVANFHGVGEQEYRFSSRPSASPSSIMLGFGIYFAKVVMDGKRYSRVFVLTR
jgi:uncharacterized protein (DUF608 family)